MKTLLLILLLPVTIWVFNDCGKAKNDLFAHTPEELPKYIDGIRVIDLTIPDTNCYETVYSEDVIYLCLFSEDGKIYADAKGIRGDVDVVLFDTIGVTLKKRVICPERGKTASLQPPHEVKTDQGR